jgi:glycosidase
MLDKYTPEKALEKVNFGSRDNARHPMTWDSSEYGGFSDSEPWLCIHSRKDEINAAKDMSSEKSVFRFYQQLLKLRKENAAFLDGSLDVISKPGDDFFIYTRALGDSRWAVVCNFKDHRDISLPFKCKVPALANLGRDRADGVYAPYECSISEIVL